MRKNSGITLVALIVTIIVMLILISVTIYYGGRLINDSHKEDVLTTMLLIQSKAKIIKEKKEFGDIETLTGIPIAENSNYIIPEELQTLLNSVDNGDLYILTQQNMDEMGIKDEVNNTEFFIVDYNNSEVYYSLGCEGEDGSLLFSLAQLDNNEIFEIAELPEGYIQLEYIESTGTQYIDTGIPATRILGIDLKVLYTGTEEAAFVGSYQMYQGILMGYSSGGFGMATNCAWKYVEVQSDNDWHEFTYRDDEGYFENKSFGLPEMKNYNNNIHLFRANSFGKNKAGVRIAICRIYKDGDLVRDFVPCYRISDGANGMYDLVTGDFYPNAAKGTDFTRGPVVNKKDIEELGYQQLEYIESTGTQYINTLYSPNNNTGIKVTISNLVMATSADKNFLGARTTSQRISLNFGKGFYSYGWGDSYTTKIPFDLTQKHTLSLNYKNDKKFIADENEIAVLPDVTFIDLPTIYIFGQHTTTGSAYYKYRVYDMQITENSSVIKDFVPCYRKSDGANGLYDLVTGEFYPKTSGGTDFVRGPEVK